MYFQKLKNTKIYLKLFVKYMIIIKTLNVFTLIVVHVILHYNLYISN